VLLSEKQAALAADQEQLQEVQQREAELEAGAAQLTQQAQQMEQQMEELRQQVGWAYSVCLAGLCLVVGVDMRITAGVCFCMALTIWLLG
jgi:predicted nuclease with TOPRIM domain